MKTVWTKGLTPQQALACRGDFVGAAPFRDRLTTLLEAKANEKRKATRSGNAYDNPNWALVQADAIGYEKALYEVISLISQENV